MRRRSADSSQVRRSRPSRRIRPSVGWYRLVSNLMKVVLPAPFSPTSARLCPLGMNTSMPRSAQRSVAAPAAGLFPGARPAPAPVPAAACLLTG